MAGKRVSFRPMIGALVALLATVALVGCVTVEDEKSPAPAADASMEMVGAIGTDEYRALEEQVLAKVPDAKLIAVRSYGTLFPQRDASASDWMFLYGSLEEQKAYSVMNGSSVIVAPYSDLEMTKSQYDAIPAVSEIAIDVDEAFRVLQDRSKGALEPLESCDVVLVTSLIGDDDVETDDDPSMRWLFDVNYTTYEQEQRAYEGGAAGALSGDVPERDAATGRGASYYVDARTGDCKALSTEE